TVSGIMGKTHGISNAARPAPIASRRKPNSPPASDVPPVTGATSASASGAVTGPAVGGAASAGGVVSAGGCTRSDRASPATTTTDASNGWERGGRHILSLQSIRVILPVTSYVPAAASSDTWISAVTSPLSSK